MIAGFARALAILPFRTVFSFLHDAYSNNAPAPPPARRIRPSQYQGHLRVLFVPFPDKYMRGANLYPAPAPNMPAIYAPPAAPYAPGQPRRYRGICCKPSVTGRQAKPFASFRKPFAPAKKNGAGAGYPLRRAATRGIDCFRPRRDCPSRPRGPGICSGAPARTY